MQNFRASLQNTKPMWILFVPKNHHFARSQWAVNAILSWNSPLNTCYETIRWSGFQCVSDYSNKRAAPRCHYVFDSDATSHSALKFLRKEQITACSSRFTTHCNTRTCWALEFYLFIHLFILFPLSAKEGHDKRFENHCPQRASSLKNIT